MGILKQSIYLAVGLALSGCYTDFTPKIDTEPVLCLNCIVTAGEPIEPDVTHTWLYTDKDGANNNQVDDAVITIYANGETVSPDYIPRAGDHIRIHARSPRYGEAEGETTIPLPIEPGKVEISPRVTFCNVWTYDTTETAIITFDMNVNVTVVDKATTEDFYHFNLYGYDSDKDYLPDNDSEILYYGGIRPGSMDTESEPIFSEHISTMESIAGASPYGFTFFTDRQFNGRSYTLNLRYSHGEVVLGGRPGELEDHTDVGFVVRVSAISSDYYTWYNYCWQVYDGMLGELEAVGLGDPIWGYSNVSTHAGVILSRNVCEYRIDMSDFVLTTIRDYLAQQSEQP